MERYPNLDVPQVQPQDVLKSRSQYRLRDRTWPRDGRQLGGGVRGASSQVCAGMSLGVCCGQYTKTEARSGRTPTRDVNPWRRFGPALPRSFDERSRIYDDG